MTSTHRGTKPATPSRALRADARRNQERLLRAARDVFIERGPHAPLEDVAERAEVGIATLYRRFPDRQALLHAVALDALTRTGEAAREAAEECAGPFDALARYLRAALELRVSAMIPAVLGVLDLEEPELGAARAESARAVDGLVERARAAGAVPADLTFADVGMMLVRISQPLPGPIAPATKQELARRHLELFLRGLRASARTETAYAGELSGPSLGLADLRALVEDS